MAEHRYLDDDEEERQCGGGEPSCPTCFATREEAMAGFDR